MPVAVATLRELARQLGVEATIVPTEAWFPPDLKAGLAKRGLTGKSKGLFYRPSDEIFLVASEIDSIEEATHEVLYHEAFHRGLRRMFGREVGPVLEYIHDANLTVRASTAEYMLKYGMEREEAIEEVLADMAGRAQAKQLTGWGRLVSLFNRWLRDRGQPAKLTDQDVETIVAGGVHYGRTAPRAGPPQTRLAAFQRWFGASKVVDQDGRPKPVSHGTGMARRIYEVGFDPAKQGQGVDAFGAGFYFSDLRQTAELHMSRTAARGDNVAGEGATSKSSDAGVVDAYLSIKRPILVDARRGGDGDGDQTQTAPNAYTMWPPLTRAQANALIKLSPGYADPWGPLSDWAADKDEAYRLAVDAYVGQSLQTLDNDFYKGHAQQFLRNYSLITGYDGAIVRVSDDETHYIPWFPEQIKSSTMNVGSFAPDSPSILHKLTSLQQRGGGNNGQYNAQLKGALLKRREIKDTLTPMAKSIRSLYDGKALWQVLVNETKVGAGPFDGCCLICAKAIIRAAGRGELVRIVAASDWQVAKYRAQGYDGAIFAPDKDDFTKRGWLGSVQIVAFNANQVKSAIGNTGDFSPLNDDIRLKRKAPSKIEASGTMFYKLREFETDEGSFAIFDTEESHKTIRDRPAMFTVLMGDAGYFVRNVILPEANRRQGLSTKFYEAMNKESLAKTGNALRSSQPRKLSTGETVHELSADAQAMWDSFVRNGKAQKLGEKDYVFLGRALRATASPASVNQADGADTVEIPMGPRGGATVEAKRIWYHDPRSRGFNADGGISGYDLPRGERVLADEFDGGVQKFVYLSPTPLSRASVPVDISSFTSRVRYTGQSEGYAIVQGDIPASALQRKQKQTDTAAFREWFGDSKVVGINAEPLVVYHGTANSFDAFQTPSNAVGTWFSASADTASRYANIKGRWQSERGDNVVPSYLSIRNPAPYDLMDSLKDEARKAGAKNPGQYVRDALEKQGYDGVTVDGGDSWIAFSATQIKSAIGNTGTFDPRDPDIRLKRRKKVNDADTSPSTLPAAPTQVDLPAFKAWFGESKLVDGSGAPLVLYHGTKSDFSEFKKHAAAKFDAGWFGSQGIYVSGSADLASAYAMRESNGSLTDRAANVMPVFVKIENPFRVNMSELSFDEASNFTAAYGGDEGFKRWLDENGFDGVVGFRDPEIAGKGAEFWEVVAFSPSQVKSAIGNRGTFSPDDPDIRLRRKGVVGEGEPSPDPAAPSQTDTPAFRNWFGDSKVTNPNGLPKAVYHGTNQDISAFIESRAGANTNSASSRSGFFFTEDASEAADYARMSARKQVINAIESEANAERLLNEIDRAQDRGDFDLAEQLTAELEQSEKEAMTGDERGANVMPVYLNIRNPVVIDMRGKDLSAMADEIAAARTLGHDGAQLINVFDPVANRGDLKETNQWVAFEPTQIKSAVGNRGTFEPDNADIRLRRKEIVSEATPSPDAKPASTDQTDTYAFRDWFRESRIVNPDGSPMVVYHGTGNSFASFNLNWRSQRAGLYFTSDAQFAGDFAQANAESSSYEDGEEAQGASVMPVYLSVRNPVDVRNGWPVEVAEKLDDVINYEWLTTLPPSDFWLAMDGDNGANIMSRLEHLGYDGLIAIEAGAPVFVAFHPTQIKSAIANDGTFDPGQADIRLRRKEIVSEVAASPNAQPAAVGQTDTDEFKGWFGQSRLVNPDGSPMLVYHGTKRDFTRFSRSRPGVGSTMFGTYEVERHGIFVTPSAELANDFALQGERNKQTGANVMPLYASIQNPLDMTQGYTDAVFNAIEKWGNDKDLNGYRIARNLGDNWGDWMLFDEDSGQDPAFLISMLKDLGYDGVKFYEPKVAGEGASGDTFVAFDPEQIKSAVGNRGTFDPGEADIRLRRKEIASEATPGPNAQPPAIDQTDTDAFKEWFGQSRIVNLDGSPKVVFHGTGVNVGNRGEFLSGDFSTFDASLSGKSSKTGAPEGSFFFTDSPDVASSYTVAWRGEWSERLKDGAKFSRAPQTDTPAFRKVDVFGNGSRVQYFDDAKDLYYESQKYPAGMTKWRAGEVIDGQTYWLSDKQYASMDEAISSVRGQRISNAIKARNQSLYGDIPRTWDGDAKRVAKALIDAGVAIERYSQSTQSTSKYIYLASGEKVRVSDHALPMRYESADYDFRVGGDIQSLVERIATPANSADQDQSASQGEMQERSVRAETSGSTEPAQINAGGGKVDITKNPAFRKWFGDSKVVNPDGTPMVVYHGTLAKFNTFQAAAGNGMFGVYFTTDKTSAGEWATRNGGNAPNVMDVFVSIQNPASDDVLEQTKEEYREQNGVDPSPQTMTDLLMAAGHDGFMDQSRYEDALEIVAFSPEQIKSAIGNRGTFDPNDADIRLKRTASPNKATPSDVTDDDGDVANAKVAFFGEESHVRFAKDPRGKIHLLGIYSDGTTRGREMVAWLANEYGKPIVNEVAPDATGFWEKMQAEGLIARWTEKRFLGDGVAFDSGSAPAAAAKQTDAPAFHNWFGHSKVVNADGSARVVYHGTNKDFSVFQNRFAGKTWEMFSDSADYASRFAIDRGGQVLPVYLALRNPLDLSLLPPVRGDVRNKLLELLEDAGIKVGETTLPFERDLYQIINIAGHKTDFKERVQAAGYDGIVMPDSHEGNPGDSHILANTYIAFEPTQIKSAVGNVGAFDTTDADIRLSRNHSAEGIHAVQPYMNRELAMQLAADESDFEKLPEVAIADAPAFKAWFGESQVVDADGQPEVLYHGTARDFTAFKESNSWEGFGFHFGTARAANEVLEAGRRRAEKGAHYVMPVYLAINNPIHFDISYDRGRHDPNDIYRMVMAKAERDGVPGVTQNEIDDFYDDDHQFCGVRFGDLEGQPLRDLLRNWLENMGYDGISYINAGEDPGSMSWIAFRPSQIKSAISNSGAFSPDDDDIRLSRKDVSADNARKATRPRLGGRP